MYFVRISLRSRKTKRSLGSGIIETAVGLILVIPVLLGLIDVAALVLAQTANDALAKQCARAAAEQSAPNGDPNAQIGVQRVPEQFDDSEDQLCNLLSCRCCWKRYCSVHYYY